MIELDAVLRQKVIVISVSCCDMQVRTTESTKEDISEKWYHILQIFQPMLGMCQCGCVNVSWMQIATCWITLAPESQQYSIYDCDAIAGQSSHIDLLNLSDKRAYMGGLPIVLILAVGARVRFTANVNVSDDLVNGAW